MTALVVDDGDEVRLLGPLLELPHYLSHPASSLRRPNSVKNCVMNAVVNSVMHAVVHARRAPCRRDRRTLGPVVPVVSAAEQLRLVPHHRDAAALHVPDLCDRVGPLLAGEGLLQVLRRVETEYGDPVPALRAGFQRLVDRGVAPGAKTGQAVGQFRVVAAPPVDELLVGPLRGLAASRTRLYMAVLRGCPVEAELAGAAESGRTGSGEADLGRPADQQALQTSVVVHPPGGDEARLGHSPRRTSPRKSSSWPRVVADRRWCVRVPFSRCSR